MDKPNQLFKAFSDETRLRILNLLAQRDHCVCEFQSILRVPQHYTARLIRQQQIPVTSVQRRCRAPPMLLATPGRALRSRLAGI